MRGDNIIALGPRAWGWMVHDSYETATNVHSDSDCTSHVGNTSNRRRSPRL